MHDSIEFDSANGTITGTTWGMPENSQAGILMVHGLGGHSPWFDRLGSRLANHAIFCLAHDQLGFGKRQDQTFQSRQQWIDDTCTSYRHLQSMLPGRPVFLLGNSMGAVVAFFACPQISPPGLVLLSPGFEGYPDSFPLSFRLSAIAKALLAPDSTVDLPYDVDRVASEPEMRQFIDSDPQKRFRLPVKMLLELLLLTLSVSSPLKSVDSPLLMLTSGQDKVVDNNVNLALFEKISSSSKRCINLENAWHDLVFDPAVTEVAELVRQWMAECAPITV